jgi:hypothetical protein
MMRTEVAQRSSYTLRREVSGEQHAEEAKERISPIEECAEHVRRGL